jgi:hypothetical protein
MISNISNWISNLKFAWAGMGFSQKVGLISVIILLSTILTVYGGALFFSGSSNQSSIASKSLEISTGPKLKQPLSELSTEKEIESRSKANQQNSNVALNSGESFIPLPDLRRPNDTDKEMIEQTKTTEVKTDPVSNTSYLDLLQDRTSRKNDQKKPEPAATPVPKVRRPPVEVMDAFDTSKTQTDASRSMTAEQIIEFRTAEAQRISALLSQRSEAVNSIYEKKSTGTFRMDLNSPDLTRSGAEEIIDSQAPMKKKNDESTSDSTCMLCPGDKLLIRITKAVDSRYTTNVEFEILEGALAGGKLFGSYRVVNKDALMKKDVRLALVTDILTLNRKTAAFPAVVIDRTTGDQIIKQDVKSFTLLKWLALASTSLASKWSDLSVAAATITLTTSDTQTQSSSLSDSDIWSASGGWVLGELSGLAQRWFDQPPIIRIDENEIVNVMIVQPINIDWLPELIYGEDYF